MLDIDYDINDLSLADQGNKRIDWAFSEMPVLRHFQRDRPLAGVRISGCLHITTETANLARIFKSGGAKLVLCASNPPKPSKNRGLNNIPKKSSSESSIFPTNQGRLNKRFGPQPQVIQKRLDKTACILLESWASRV